jgi:hypothetical protein
VNPHQSPISQDGQGLVPWILNCIIVSSSFCVLRFRWYQCNDVDKKFDVEVVQMDQLRSAFSCNYTNLRAVAKHPKPQQQLGDSIEDTQISLKSHSVGIHAHPLVK